MGWKRKVHQMAEGLFDIPTEITSEDVRLEWVGKSLLQIENHQGMDWFQPDEVRLHSKTGKLKINGSNLKIESMNRYEIRISGQIESIQYQS
ncbi:sporulation protein YqfC [Seinonella peptonophila]|uniref:Sporulation protein YqfC n=1 Tax=Seinonella peptonophila TaxID=112248 RepID=A0A1M4V7I6_9BACL|nr:YabP/YqfC family sporulation protein [Seinonella peptonophila]SHE64914.1 sporulation protein YqfC [Seinonella peptonophila]